MDSELQALALNSTWQIVDLPPGVVPIDSKSGYKIKRHANGSIERYKSRLESKGYSKVEGPDYLTHSPLFQR